VAAVSDRFELADGADLAELNEAGLLTVALRRSGGHEVNKATAWDLLTDHTRLAGDCPGPCAWPASCVREGRCWHREASEPYIPRWERADRPHVGRDDGKRGDSERYRRRIF
jgi:hypothetical protein